MAEHVRPHSAIGRLPGVAALPRAPPSLSPFWIAHGSATFVLPEDSELTVSAGFAFGGPGERYDGRAPPGPVALWTPIGRLAERISVAARRRETAALRERALASFRPGPVLDASLSALPPYAELGRASVLGYIPSMRFRAG